MICIASLIGKAKRGDRDAFTALIEQHKEMLYNTAMLLLRNEDDALDAVQDAILSCWEELPALKHTQYFKTWLTRILLNKCYDCLRFRKHFAEPGADFDPGVETDWDTGLDVGQALERLPQMDQVVLSLFYYDGFRTKEIAKALSISDEAVRVRLSRSRNRFKKILTEENLYEKQS